MSSVEYLREFVSERLTAAAEEIFRVFKQTVIEYEEEIDRHCRLLDIAWKPEVKLHRIELPQQHVYKEEEVLTDQQLCNQERNSSLDQEDPELPQIKEEEEDELCTSQEGEQLELKQETDISVLSPPYEQSDDSEDQTLYFNPDVTQSAAEKDSDVNKPVKSSVVPETNSDLQLLSNKCDVAESQDQTGDEHGDSGSTRHAESKQNNQQHKSKRNINSVYNPTMSKIDCCTGKKSFKCDTCGKDFKYKSSLKAHLTVHTGEKPYLCQTCGKSFTRLSTLRTHMKIHTGEKPYSCQTCGKSLLYRSALSVHMRVHTGEKPFNCKICGREYRSHTAFMTHKRRVHSSERPFICTMCEKGFVTNYELTHHMRIHTGKRPFHCVTCGRDFYHSIELKRHVQVSHRGERPFKCETCGKCLTSSTGLTKHRRIHTGERPFTCKTCGKCFRRSQGLTNHMRIHTGEKPYSCKECGRAFTSIGSLSNHKRRSHSDQKTVPFQGGNVS